MQKKNNLLARDLRKTFRQQEASIEVLRGVNLDISTGEIVAVLGSSGSGKSTLLGVLAGLDSPDSGSVIIDGESLYEMPQEDRTRYRASRMGMVFQNFHLMNHLTALENVALPMEILGQASPESEAEILLKSVGLEHRLRHLPSQMSGGECQRIAIARALAIKPKIILADEPSGNLDQSTSARVMGLFFEQLRSRSVSCVLVTHNLELAKLCDRSLSMREGILWD